MFCGQCGTERTSEDARFCRSCGADFAPPVPPSRTEQHNDPGEVTAVRLVWPDSEETAQLAPAPAAPLGGWTAATPASSPEASPHRYPAGVVAGPTLSPAESPATSGGSRLPLFAGALVLLVVGGLIGYVAVTWLLPL